MCSNMDQIVDRDVIEEKSPTQETIELLKSLKDNTNNCIEMTNNLLFRLKDNQLSTQNGNSFMALKNKIFISYLMDLTFLVSSKICGERVEESDVIKRLVENRTVLERMKPIEHKLKYTFDKLIKTSTDGTIDPNDPLRLRPNLNTIVDNDQQMSADGEDDTIDSTGNEEIWHQMNGKRIESKSKTSGVYVPPKVAQMRFDAEEDRKGKALERAKKRAINTSIISELKHEFDVRPQEIFDSMHSRDNKMSRFLKDKTAYEEEYMTRMSLSKKQANEAKKMQTMTSLASGLTRFEDISALDVNNANEFEFDSKKKSISMSKKSNKFKRKTKRFKK